MKILSCVTEAELKTETRLTIDDRRHGQDDTIAVVDDGVHRLVFNNVEVMLQVVVSLCESEKNTMLAALRQTSGSSNQHQANELFTL